MKRKEDKFEVRRGRKGEKREKIGECKVQSFRYCIARDSAMPMIM
jgi:hypothetical protein